MMEVSIEICITPSILKILNLMHESLTIFSRSVLKMEYMYSCITQKGVIQNILSE